MLDPEPNPPEPAADPDANAHPAPEPQPISETGGPTPPHPLTPSSSQEPVAASAPHLLTSSPPHPPDPWAHRRGEPRTFAAFWILFLFTTTVLTLGAIGVFGILSTDVYRPAARALLELVAVGTVVLWPMVRLSQQAPERPFRTMFIDVFVVTVPAQVVIWPQALGWMAAWPMPVVGAIAATLAAWALLMAGLLGVYFGASERAGEHMPRWAMMALLVLLVTVAPVTIALSHQPHDDLLMASPLTAMYELTRDRLWTGQSAAVDIRHWAAIWLTWGAAGLVWVMAGVASRVAVRPQHA